MPKILSILTVACLFLVACTAPGPRPPRPVPPYVPRSGPPAPVPPPGPGPAPAPAPAPAPGNTPGIDPDPGPPGIQTDHPRLVFTAPGHDFGSQEKGVKTTHTAVFYNVGAAPLTISKVKTHCGCAAALLSDKLIPPGGRGTLSVTLDTGSLAGKRIKTVEVFTNDPEQPVAKYAISCHVIADAMLDPIVLVVRATRAEGEVKAHFDVITMRPGFDLRIRGVTTSHEDLTAEVVPIPAGEEKTGYRVHLSFGPAFGSGDFTQRVTVLTNSTRDEKMTINVIGSVRQAVLVVPERLYYPFLRPGQPVTRSLYVYRDDGKPLTITRVEDPSGLFETEFTRMKPSKWEIKVTIGGESPKRTVRGSLVIHTDAPKEPLVTVPFELPGEGDG